MMWFKSVRLFDPFLHLVRDHIDDSQGSTGKSRWYQRRPPLQEHLFDYY